MASERDRDAKRKAEKRKAERECVIPRCKDRRRRKKLEADDERWLMHYFGAKCGLRDPFTYTFTTQQREMIEAFKFAMIFGGDQATAASRGEGKTTIFERLCVKYTLQGVLSFVALFGANATMANNSLDTIKTAFEENDLLFEDYPEICYPVRHLENIAQKARGLLVSGFRHDNNKKFYRQQARFTWCGDEVVLPKVPGAPGAGAIIATRGLDSGTAVRGLKKRGRRPQLACIDDPDTEETISNEIQADKLEKRIDRAIGGLGSQDRPIARIMLTTLQNRTCVSYKFTDPAQKPSWKGKRFRFLIKPPARTDLWEEYVSLYGRDLVEFTAGKHPDPHCRRSHGFYLENRDPMDEGAEVANPNRFDRTLLPDGTKAEESALQHYYNQVARVGQEAVSTELDNNPSDEEGVERTLLSAYHVQHNCRSGLDQRVVPEDAVGIVAGVDIKKNGFHVSVWAFDVQARGCCIDYYFYDISTEGVEMQAVERIIRDGLGAWSAEQDENPYHDVNGHERIIDLAMVDEGWKHESWASQPVRDFCLQHGTSRFMPCKGESPYKHKTGKTVATGDNLHISWPDGVPFVVMNSDHWKQKVHEGFLSPREEPGSLSLFTPSQARRGQPHMSFAKHLVSEVWEKRFVPGFRGWKEGWYKTGGQNHYFDATYQALAGRSILGISVMGVPVLRSAPVPQASSRYPDSPEDFGGGGRSRSW